LRVYGIALRFVKGYLHILPAFNLTELQGFDLSMINTLRDTFFGSAIVRAKIAPGDSLLRF
jgi:hypothetical protein